jgi:chemotaxis protein methyltransferase CheR
MTRISELAELIEHESGIRLKPNQFPSLRAALERAVPGVGPNAFLAQAVEPFTRRELVERLLDEVTVKETTFLRDREQLEKIDWHGLLGNARARGGDALRVWSAGCATGEEPYTLALLACERLGASPPVQILATDLSRAALTAARTARYRARAVRELEPELVDRYFIREGDDLVVDDPLRSLVELQQHNLVRDPAPPPGAEPFDLILCRNVLIYFELATVERVISSLEGALSPGGMLVVGAADALCGTAGRLAAATRTAQWERRPAEAPRLRRPLGRDPARPREQLLAHALDAANRGSADEAVAQASAILADDPLDADAYFLRGMVELETGDATHAAASLRRALYADPSFGLAAFKLGRACDALGDGDAARRAYEQALRTLQPQDDRHELMLQQVDLGDVAAACRARIAALR